MSKTAQSQNGRFAVQEPPECGGGDHRQPSSGTGGHPHRIDDHRSVHTSDDALSVTETVGSKVLRSFGVGHDLDPAWPERFSGGQPPMALIPDQLRCAQCVAAPMNR